MNVSTHHDAELYAATDRYAQAILHMESGDPAAREEVMDAYRRLQKLSSADPASSVPQRSIPAPRIRDYARRALQGLGALVETRYGPAGFLS